MLLQNIERCNHINNFDMTLNFLTSLSGASINRLFCLRPGLYQQFQIHFHGELKSLTSLSSDSPFFWVRFMDMYTTMYRALRADQQSPVLPLFKKLKTFAVDLVYGEDHELPGKLAIHILKKNPWVANVAPWEI